MSFSNYEQTVVVNDIALSGVTNVNGSYGISERPIRVAGVGFIDAFVDAPLEGNFTISRKMVSRDPILDLNVLGQYNYDENEISGSILYDNSTKGFGFTKGRVTRYSVNCTVGDLPDVQTDITVFGDLGSGILIQQPSKSHPPIQFTDQASIVIRVSDFSIDAVTDFSYSRSLNLQPMYAIPKGTEAEWSADSKTQYTNHDPIQIDTIYPIETDINFTMIADEYQVRQTKDRLRAAPESDVVIEIKDSKTKQIINSFTGVKARLISESSTSSVEGEMSISLTYKGYETLHNPVI
jgi:hypothetical protein